MSTAPPAFTLSGAAASKLVSTDLDNDWDGDSAGVNGEDLHEDLWCALPSSHADDWVRRSRALIPYTGAVPFNAEPAISTMDSVGLPIMPAAIHYVRNHGPVPKVDESDFTLQIAFDRRTRANWETVDATTFKSFSMADVRQLPSQTVLATLCCNGNRRKEMNMLRHTKEFDSGPCFVGCSEWRGVKFTDFMQYAKISAHRTPEQLWAVSVNEAAQQHTAVSESAVPFGRACSYRFVIFEGSDDGCAGGKYATALALDHCLNAANDVLLAYEQNGSPLRPDHGAPIRLVVPGFVGGRWIKWLRRIVFSNSLSDSHYEWEDNRRWPSAVSISQLNSGSLVDRRGPEPNNRCMELHTNSVITFPHDKVTIQLVQAVPKSGDKSAEKSSANPEHQQQASISMGMLSDSSVLVKTLADELEVRGFAYSGGGRRIVAVEVSCDGGKSWRAARTQSASELRAAKQTQMEKPAHNEEKKSAPVPDAETVRPSRWEWCVWSASFAAYDLLGPADAELVVRAFDESWNPQTDDVSTIWNVAGLMNNSYYRVKVRKQKGQLPTAALTAGSLQGKDGTSSTKVIELDFDHPVHAGADTRGWMAAQQTALGDRMGQHSSRSCHTELPRLHRAGPLVGLASHKAHKMISRSELAAHRSKDSCWIVLEHDQVYDVTPYLRQHPGTAFALLAAAHMDPFAVSTLFRSIHGGDALDISNYYLIGVLVEDEMIRALTEGKKRDQFQQLPSTQHVDFIDMDNSQRNLVTRPPVAGMDFRSAALRRPNWHQTPIESPRAVLQRKLSMRTHSDSDSEELHISAAVPLDQAPPLIRRDSDVDADVCVLDPRRWQALQLICKQWISDDTVMLKFRASDGAYRFFGITTCQHVLVGIEDKGEWVVRPYTPVYPASIGLENVIRRTEMQNLQGSSTATAAAAASKGNESTCLCASAVGKGVTFELLVKVYRAVHGHPGGRLSQLLGALEVGDERVKVKGPAGYILYEGRGCFNIHTVGVRATLVNLIGGGSGITPLYQLIREILLRETPAELESARPGTVSQQKTTWPMSGASSDHSCRLCLVYANKTVDDILMRQPLEELARRFPRQFAAVFVVSKLPADDDSKNAHAEVKDAQHAKQTLLSHFSSYRIPAIQTMRSAASTLGEAASANGSKAADNVTAVSPGGGIVVPTTSPGASEHSPVSGGTVRSSGMPTGVIPVVESRLCSPLLRRCVFGASSSTLTFLCGPPGMVAAVNDELFSLGFQDNDIVEF